MSRSPPVFKRKAIEAAEIFSIVSYDRPVMTQPGGGDEDIGDADRRALVEQSGVEAGGDAGATGIKRQNLQVTNRT